MSDTYTKLFSSITESTVWGEPYATRIVWVAMLAMADARGNVYGAVPGLARRANVTLQEAQAALAAFLAPDPYSRTRDEDGRRVEEIDGGWHLINHAKYGAVRGAEERREVKREWDRQNRPSGHARAKQSDRSPTVRQQSDESPPKSVSPAPPALTPTPDKSMETSSPEQPSAARSRFDEFWAVYPKKVGKKPTQAKWKAKRLDALADRIVADVLNRIANDGRWLDGFIPDPKTYLTQERWDDELQPRREAPTGQGAAPVVAPRMGPTPPTEKTALEREVNYIRHQHHYGLIDDAERDRQIAAARLKHRSTHEHSS